MPSNVRACEKFLRGRTSCFFSARSVTEQKFVEDRNPKSFLGVEAHHAPVVRSGFYSENNCTSYPKQRKALLTLLFLK